MHSHHPFPNINFVWQSIYRRAVILASIQQDGFTQTRCVCFGVSRVGDVSLQGGPNSYGPVLVRCEYNKIEYTPGLILGWHRGSCRCEGNNLLVVCGGRGEREAAVLKKGREGPQQLPSLASLFPPISPTTSHLCHLYSAYPPGNEEFPLRTTWQPPNHTS